MSVKTTCDGEEKYKVVWKVAIFGQKVKTKEGNKKEVEGENQEKKREGKEK